MSTTSKSVLMLGCFDTKGEVFAFLRECLLAQGEQVITINTGVMGSTEAFPVDYEADLVALQAGTTLAALRQAADRGHAVEVMGRGAARLVARLVAGKQIRAAIGMGGGGGTYIALAAMQAIPIGIPKLCLSTVVAKDLSRQLGHKDITLMPSVVDVAGLNSISKVLIAQAAGALSGMARVSSAASQEVVGRVAISMFGNTTACVDQCTALLQARGYEVFAFHATGVGGKAMEALMREGCFDAVLDITTTELADELCGGICSAGPDRLQAAAEMGLPQVVVPGCLDMVNFAQPDTVPERYRARQLYSWAPDVTLMRTEKDENIILGEKLSQKLNQAAAPAAILLPKKGLSQIDAPGGIFYRPEINQALFDSIRKHAGRQLEVVELDAHINDAAFAGLAVKVLLELLEKNSQQQASAGEVTGRAAS